MPEVRLASGPGDPAWPRTEQLLAPLIAPIAAWAAAGDRVVLCPHDALHRFPLHAVGLGGRPLAERNVVSYVPSAGVLRHCLTRPHVTSGTAMIIADAGSGDPDVPGATPLLLARDQAIARSSSRSPAQAPCRPPGRTRS